MKILMIIKAPLIVNFALEMGYAKKNCTLNANWAINVPTSMILLKLDYAKIFKKMDFVKMESIVISRIISTNLEIIKIFVNI
jgi:hypothetical protein